MCIIITHRDFVAALVVSASARIAGVIPAARQTSAAGKIAARFYSIGIATSRALDAAESEHQEYLYSYLFARKMGVNFRRQ